MSITITIGDYKINLIKCIKLEIVTLIFYFFVIFALQLYVVSKEWQGTFENAFHVGWILILVGNIWLSTVRIDTRKEEVLEARTRDDAVTQNEFGLCDQERRIMKAVIEYCRGHDEPFALLHVAKVLRERDWQRLDYHLQALVKKGFLRYEGVHEGQPMYALEERGYALS